MGYKGGDLLLAAAACDRLLLGHCAGLCVQDVGGDQKRHGGLGSVTKSALEVSIYRRRAIQIDVLPYLTSYHG